MATGKTGGKETGPSTGAKRVAASKSKPSTAKKAPSGTKPAQTRKPVVAARKAPAEPKTVKTAPAADTVVQAPPKDSPISDSGPANQGSDAAAKRAEVLRLAAVAAVSALFAVLLGMFLGSKLLAPVPQVSDNGTQAGVVADLRNTVARLGAELSDTQSALATLQASAAAGQPAAAFDPQALDSLQTEISGQMADMEAALSAVRRDLAGLSDTIDAGGGLLTSDGEMSPEIQARLEATLSDLEALRADVRRQAGENQNLAAQVAELEATAAEKIAAADAAARQSAQDAALSVQTGDLRAALETGAPYATTLSRLSLASSVDIPDALQAAAASGVADVPTLLQMFPDAARAGLKAALAAQTDGGLGDRFMAFLKGQVGSRSLEAKEGDDPDAVLSRAEADLIAGRVKAAVAGVRSLPDASVAAMADWIDAAQGRLDAVSAFDTYVMALGLTN